MARHFDGSTHITIADHPALLLGDDVDDSGSFSLSFLIKKGTMADSEPKYIAHWGIISEAVIVGIYGDNHATLAGKITLIFASNYSGGDKVSIVFNDAITDANWHHVALVFDGTTLRAWLDNSLQTATSTCSGLDTIDLATPWYFGRASDIAGYYFTGDLAEWAKWDSELSTDEIAALAAGVRPPEVGTRPAWYMPMLAGLEEEIAGLAATNNGTTIAEHPPKIVGAGQYI